MKEVENKTILTRVGESDAGGSEDVTMEEAFANSRESGDSGDSVDDTESNSSPAGIGEIEESDSESTKDAKTTTDDQPDDPGSVTVSFASVTTSGPGKLEASAIRSVVKRQLGSLQRCLERAHEPTETTLSDDGEVSADIRIGRRGRVTKQSVELDDAPHAADCIEHATRRWRFPRPKGGAVTATLNFSYTASEAK